MRLEIPVLVSLDKHDRFELRVPFTTLPSFRGPALHELLDDLALHLMEQLPQGSTELLPKLCFAPSIRVHRVRVETALHFGGGRQATPWKGALSVVSQRWPCDDFVLCTVPRLGGEPFAVAGTGDLAGATASWLHRWAKGQSAEKLDAGLALPDARLEILEVDTELPTVLGSRRPTRRKRRSKPGARKDKPRRFVAPTTLRSVGTNLANRARDGRLQPAFGRDELVTRVLRELQRPGAAVLLVGPSGVGKSAIVHEVARRLAAETDDPLQRTDLWEVDGNRLIAGMSVVGAWESRVEAMLGELDARQDVLFVDDLPTLVYTGRSAQSDTNVAQLLDPALGRRELRLLGECTAERLAVARDENPGFFSRFRVLQVPPMDEAQTLMVLLRGARQVERERPVVFRPEAFAAMLELTRRFEAHHHQPGAAMRLLRRVADLAGGGRADDAKRRTLDRNQVVTIYGRVTGLPDFALSPAHARPPQEIRRWLEHRVLAQPQAMAAVTDAIVTLQQALDDPERPIATMLLVGPTGVGKTETAKALASWLFGDESRMVRFDMSEFRGPGAATRLVGSVGQPDGELTRQVAAQPFSVVLFDEIEKAHPAIFDVLLQVLGEGRLTNGAGRTTSFSSTVVLMTSNLGVREARGQVGFVEQGGQEQDGHYRRSAQAFFRPEFYNRIDRVVPYRALQRGDVVALVARLVEQLLTRRGLRRSGVLVRVDPAVVDRIVDEGFDLAFGARALKRTLERRLTRPLARALATRQVGPLTHVDVFPRGSELHLVPTELQRSTVPDREQRLPPADWEALAQAHAQVVEGFDRLTRSPPWEAARDAREALLEKLQGPGLEGDEEARLTLIGQLVERAQALQAELTRLADERLSSFHFLDRVELERYSPRGWRRDERKRPVSSADAVPVERSRLLPRAREELHSVAVDLAALRYRLRQLELPLEPVLIRVLPEVDDPAGRKLARMVASAMLNAWRDWGTTTMVDRSEQGEWLSTQDHVDPAGARKTPHGNAVLLQVAGLEPLLPEQLGFVLKQREEGASRVTALVRIEQILMRPSDQDDGLAVALAALEREEGSWTDFLRQRAAGDEAVDPRPILPLQMVLEPDDQVSVPGLAQELRERGLARLPRED